jgi:hypothetical protein
VLLGILVLPVSVMVCRLQMMMRRRMVMSRRHHVMLGCWMLVLFCHDASSRGER